MAHTFNRKYVILLPDAPAAGHVRSKPTIVVINRVTSGGARNVYKVFNIETSQEEGNNIDLVEATFDPKILAVFETPAALSKALEERASLNFLFKLRSHVLPLLCRFEEEELLLLRYELGTMTIFAVPRSAADELYPPAEIKIPFAQFGEIQVGGFPPEPLQASSVQKTPTLLIKKDEHMDEDGHLRFRVAYGKGRSIDTKVKWMKEAALHCGMKNAPDPLSLKGNKLVHFDPVWWPLLIVQFGVPKFIAKLRSAFNQTHATVLGEELQLSTDDKKGKDGKAGKFAAFTMRLEAIYGIVQTFGIVVVAPEVKWTDFAPTIKSLQTLLYPLLENLKLGVKHPGEVDSVTPPWYYREKKGVESLGKSTSHGLEVTVDTQ